MELIVAVNDTDEGMEALETAIERALAAGDNLTVATFTEGAREIEKLEERVRGILEEHSLDADIERIDDDPASSLVELTEIGNYDQILLPGGKKSPLGKIKIDNTIEFVLLNARTSVTLVR